MNTNLLEELTTGFKYLKADLPRLNRAIYLNKRTKDKIEEEGIDLSSIYKRVIVSEVIDDNRYYESASQENLFI